MKFGLLAMSDNCAERGFISSCHELRSTFEKFGSCHLEYCGTIQELFAGMVKELESADTVVVAVSPRHYIRCKKKLIAALGILAVCSPQIKDLLAAQNLKGARVPEYALIPDGAAVLDTPDGLYSGFAVESQDQRILFVAADGERLPALIEGRLIPYLSGVTGITPAPEEQHGESTDSPQSNDPAAAGIIPPPVPVPPEQVAVPTEPPAAVPVWEPEREPQWEAESTEQAMDLRAALSDAIDSLNERGVRVAIAHTKTAAFIRRQMEEDTPERSPLIYSGFTCKRNGEKPREYAARLAMGALDEENTGFGAAITNIFTSEGEMTVYVAIADGESAHVRRLSGAPEERPEQLIEAAFCELCQSFKKLQSGVTAWQLAGDAPVVVAEEKAAESSRSISKRAQLITGACIGVLVLICVIMGICLREPSASAFNAADAVDTTYYTPSYRTAVQPETESTTEPETEEPSTEEPETEEETEEAEPVTQPENDPEEAGGVGGGEEAAPPVIHEDPEETSDEDREPEAEFSGTFTITTYGYGHGVGMSQYGANEFAKDGWSYSEILMHYYSGTAVIQDEQAGKEGIPTADDIARVVQQEMGSSFETEAIKAQAVAAYTYARNHNNSLSGMSSVSDISKVSDKVRSAVQAVYGQMIVYNGRPINAVFHAMSAGTTAASEVIWGGSIPYLTPVDSAGDTEQSRYQVTRTYSAQEMAGILNDALGVTMSGDPDEWFSILEHDSAVSEEIGYVETLRVQINSGAYTDISGNYFRENVMGYSRMRSPCFTIDYTA